MHLILTGLTLGFIGSLHCVGMCGPIALALPLDQKSLLTKIAGVLSYNGGRMFTYAVFGGIFGLLGQSLVIAGYQQMVSIILGTAILILVLMPNAAFNKYKITGAIYFFIGKLKQHFSSLLKKRGYSSLFFIGTLNGLLPCGLVYMGIAAAIAIGDSMKSSLFMAMFGMGTLPAMILLSLLGNSINMKFRNKINKAVPAFLVATAVLLIVRGMNLGIPYISPEMSMAKPIVHHCCHK